MSAAAVDILSQRCTFCSSGIGLDAERGTSMSTRTITLRTGSGQVKSTIEVQGRISQYRTGSGKQVQAARGVDGHAYICVHGRWRPTNMQLKAGV